MFGQNIGCLSSKFLSKCNCTFVSNEIMSGACSPYNSSIAFFLFDPWCSSGGNVLAFIFFFPTKTDKKINILHEKIRMVTNLCELVSLLQIWLHLLDVLVNCVDGIQLVCHPVNYDQ